MSCFTIAERPTLRRSSPRRGSSTRSATAATPAPRRSPSARSAPSARRPQRHRAGGRAGCALARRACASARRRPAADDQPRRARRGRSRGTSTPAARLPRARRRAGDAGLLRRRDERRGRPHASAGARASTPSSRRPRALAYEKALDRIEREGFHCAAAPAAHLRAHARGLREPMTEGSGDLVFVGGTGRSGTHILGRLLGRHARFADVPIEARFHCNKRGMPDLLEGRITLARVPREAARLLVAPRPGRRAAARPLQPDHACRLRRGRRALRGELPRRPGRPPAGTSSWTCSGRVAERRRSPAWSRCAPTTSARRRRCAAFPGGAVHPRRPRRPRLRLLGDHQDLGPRPRRAPAIDWWADRLRAIEDGVRGRGGRRRARASGRTASARRPRRPRRPRPRARLRRLLGFLGVEDEPTMRDFFEREMSAERAHLGRWAQGLGRPAARGSAASTSGRCPRSSARATTSPAR